ncbi:MAG: hypothetical protein WCP01_11100, partial [Methylococcaceae bacterium]
MLFYSPHPNPLQQERELSPAVTYCFIMHNSCVDTYAPKGIGIYISPTAPSPKGEGWDEGKLIDFD